MDDDFDFNFEQNEPTSIKVLTIVGRSSSITDFQNTLKSHLSDPFKIKGVIPLEQDDEAKNYLAYVDPGSDWREVEEDQYYGLAKFLADVGMYSVEVHDTALDAINFVNEEYKDRVYAPFKEPISAREIAHRDIFLGLIATGEIGIVRGLLDGQPVVALVHGAEGTSEAKDTLVTPYAILVNDDLGSRLQIPFNSSFDN